MKNVNNFLTGFDISNMSNKEVEMFLLTFLFFKPWDCQISKHDVEVRNKTGKQVLTVYCNHPDRPVMYLSTFDEYVLFCKDLAHTALFNKFSKFMDFVTTELKYY